MKYMKKNKQEKAYFNIEESKIDPALLAGIKRADLIKNLTTLIITICNAVLFIFILSMSYIAKPLFLALCITIVVICLCSLILEIIFSVKLGKFRKELLKTTQADTAKNKNKSTKEPKGK